MTHYFQTKGPGTFLQPSGVGGMGYAIPAAMAAKLVHRDRKVVAVCGDGGFAIGMNGLMTALADDIPITVATPMTTPRMVRKDLSLLFRNESSASSRISGGLRRRRPQPRPARHRRG